MTSDRPDCPARLDTTTLPALSRDISFLGMTVTQFLGAFNDNLFKQLMLLLSLRIADQDRQPIAMFVFSVPFVLFSGYAGYLADRYSKRVIIILSKMAEILAMLLGLLAFAMFGSWGFPGLLLVLFLMGTQSAFFGPGKYGILPEMLRPKDLPAANGVVLMTTFLAIIMGAVAAGFSSDRMLGSQLPVTETAHRLWIGSLVCVGIAVIGTLTSLPIRSVPPAVPGLQFTPAALSLPVESRVLLRQDRAARCRVGFQHVLACCGCGKSDGKLLGSEPTASGRCQDQCDARLHRLGNCHWLDIGWHLFPGKSQFSSDAGGRLGIDALPAGPGAARPQSGADAWIRWFLCRASICSVSSPACTRYRYRFSFNHDRPTR